MAEIIGVNIGASCCRSGVWRKEEKVPKLSLRNRPLSRKRHCNKETYYKNADIEDFCHKSLCVLGDSQTFAALFARYPGYVTSATRSRDQHVILIVLARASPTDSRLVHKLLHTLTTQPHKNYAKYHQKHPMAEDRNGPSSFFDCNREWGQRPIWW